MRLFKTCTKSLRSRLLSHVNQDIRVEAKHYDSGAVTLSKVSRKYFKAANVYYLAPTQNQITLLGAQTPIQEFTTLLRTTFRSEFWCWVLCVGRDYIDISEQLVAGHRRRVLIPMNKVISLERYLPTPDLISP